MNQVILKEKLRIDCQQHGSVRKMQIAGCDAHHAVAASAAALQKFGVHSFSVSISVERLEQYQLLQRVFSFCIKSSLQIGTF